MAVATALIVGTATLAGAGISAYSSIKKGEAQKNQLEAQEALLNEQARVANEQAGVAQVKSEEEATERSRQLSAQIGSDYANWAGNGLSTSGRSSDTLGNILNTQVAEGIADIDTIKDNGALAVWSYQNQANAYRTQAAMANEAADSAVKSSYLSAWGTGISGVGSAISSAGGTYSGMKSAGFQDTYLFAKSK